MIAINKMNDRFYRVVTAEQFRVYDLLLYLRSSNQFHERL